MSDVGFHGDATGVRAAQLTIDPVCALHGKRWSEHEGGRCLHCCLCFGDITPDECWQDEAGQRWDVHPKCRALDDAAFAASVVPSRATTEEHT